MRTNIEDISSWEIWDGEQLFSENVIEVIHD